MDSDALHRRTRRSGARLWVYWPLRTSIQVFCQLYFRMVRMGAEHVPARGPAIVVCNHRSFLDPFVVGTMARRPMYYVAKRELFAFHPVVGWLLNSVGAFPVSRGYGDEAMMDTAKQLLARGEIVLIFPEGTRRRPGPLGKPRRGAAHLALATGAPVVPVAIIGTEAARKGWRIRPHKVRALAGEPIQFERDAEPGREAITAATERIWAAVSALWETLGGELAPARSAAATAAARSSAAMAAADEATTDAQPTGV